MLRRFFPFLLAALLTVSFLNCGGGGGGGGSSEKNSDPVTVSGPDGSTLTTPVGGLNGNAAVQLTEATDDTADITDAGETIVSTPLLIDTTDDDNALMGDGTYSLSIPVDTSTITDTNKLELKVKLTTGAVYPVYGVYDSQTGTFKAELSGLMNGWVIAVVEDPTIQVILPAEGSTSSVRGWLTDQDWKTYEWAVVNHTTMTEADVREKILPVMWSSSETLANAGFRSPKIYIDPRLTPQARVVHLIGGIGPNDEGSHFSPGTISYANGNWIYTEEQGTFDTSLLDDEQLSALGQMYVNYDQFVKYNTDYGTALENIVIHELYHSVQHGYDIRKSQGSLKAYFDGTATPLGQTFQATAGSITGPSVAVRVLRPNEHARLYQAVDDPVKPFYYTKQDFFAYVTKRYGGNSFKWTDQLFEYMNTKTSGKFGQTEAQYRALYRDAMDEAFQALFSKSLSKIYKEYAMDRAYQHDASYSLRPSEETEANGFGQNHIAKTLFKLNDADETGFKELDPTGTNKIVEFAKVEPLSCYAFYMMVPFQSDTEEQESFPLVIKLENGEILSGDSGIKIVAFIEDMNETMVDGGMVEITDVSKPVEIPFMEGGVYLTVLVMNCYVEDKNVKVTVSAGPYIESLSPNPAAPGAKVTVTGLSFGATQGTSTLELGNDDMEIVSWSDTEIAFTLPATAESDKVKVTVGGVESNEVELSVGETAGNWEMFLDVWNVDDTCENVMPHYWDFMRIQERMPVTVANNGNVTFDYTGSASYYVNTGGSDLHVWGTGTFLDNKLQISGQWTHQRSWGSTWTEYENGTGDLLDVVETYTISCNGTFTASGHIDTIIFAWWADDFSATYSTTSSYVKTRDGEEVDSDSDSCSGTIVDAMNEIADFKKKE